MISIRLAHISDLHFGALGQLEHWNLLRDYLNGTIQPDIILITGDIVDTPREDLYELARREITQLRPNDRIYVCPGNHDRHPKGNAPGIFTRLWGWVGGPGKAAALFDQKLGHRVPHLNNRVTVPLSRLDNNWKLRILALDSSINAQYSAQGFIRLQEFQKLPEAMKEADDIDLAILLVHHHLLPIPELERSAQSTSDLFKFTTMLNAGSLLEAISHSHIDLVLHGHEHHRSLARYGTYRGRRPEIAVLGAGSATGTVTLKSCDPARMSFNLIELRPDDSVWVKEIRYQGGTWSLDTAPEVEIFDTGAVRRTRFSRQTQSEMREAPESEIVKHIEFRRNRDILIYQYMTNFLIQGKPLLNIIARNSSGKPTYPNVSFESNDQVRYQAPPEFNRYLPEHHTYIYQVKIQNPLPLRVRSLYVEYLWQDGAILTENDLQLLDPANAGPYRNQGYEFGAVRVPDYFSTLSLSVTIPPSFVPRDDDVEVFVSHPDRNQGEPQPRIDLRERLRLNRRGTYSLTVSYPEKGALYAIAWKLPSGEMFSVHAHEFNKAAHTNGNELMEAFRRGLKGTPFDSISSLSLYVPVLEERGLSMVIERVGISLGTQAPQRKPPDSLKLSVISEQNNVYTQAWWEETWLYPASSAQHLSAKELALGFVPGEYALVTMPVMHGGVEHKGPPWGIVRVAMCYNTLCEYQTDKGSNDLLSTLSIAMVSMLNAFMLGEGVKL